MKNKIPHFTGILLLLLMIACNNPGDKTLTIFHAGSLSVPLDSIAQAYEARNPGVNILMEGAGSRECARKIAELGRECDIFASADYTVIENLLIPEYASWYINFASNEMCIAYTGRSTFSEQVSTRNWPEILMRDEVLYGRSNPDLDPCGYRTVLCLQLAEDHYGFEGLAKGMLAKDREHIRPKETDLLALLESGTIDYIFIYRSVARQHGLNYIILPDSVNLKEPALAEHYAGVSVNISGKSINETTTKTGEPMIYGLCIPENAPNKELAIDFLEFMLSAKGIEIMEHLGQASLVPSCNEYYFKIPKKLNHYAKDCR